MFISINNIQITTKKNSYQNQLYLTWKNGCFKASSAEILFIGSIVNSFFNRSINSG